MTFKRKKKDTNKSDRINRIDSDTGVRPTCAKPGHDTLPGVRAYVTESSFHHRPQCLNLGHKRISVDSRRDSHGIEPMHEHD